MLLSSRREWEQRVERTYWEVPQDKRHVAGYNLSETFSSFDCFDYPAKERPISHKVCILNNVLCCGSHGEIIYHSPTSAQIDRVSMD